jgi:hypothetical protein
MRQSPRPDRAATANGSKYPSFDDQAPQLRAIVGICTWQCPRNQVDNAVPGLVPKLGWQASAAVDNIKVDLNPRLARHSPEWGGMDLCFLAIADAASCLSIEREG